MNQWRWKFSKTSLSSIGLKNYLNPTLKKNMKSISNISNTPIPYSFWKRNLPSIRRNLDSKRKRKSKLKNNFKICSKKFKSSKSKKNSNIKTKSLKLSRKQNDRDKKLYNSTPNYHFLKSQFKRKRHTSLK